MKVHSIKSNLATLKETGEKSYNDDDQKNIDQNDKDQNEGNTNRELDDLCEESITKIVVKSSSSIL